ncbi:MAG: trigger factor [Pseudomonadota bacterium]
MEVSVENTGGLARRVTVQVPAERIEQEVRSRLQTMSRTARLDGFRPGKAPMRVLEQKYGRQVRLEIIEKMMSSTLQEALIQNSIRPAGIPSIEATNTRPGEPLEYVATFEVFPELQGQLNYAFTVVRPVVEIGADDINGMLDNLRRQRADWQVVERVARAGDQVVIDFEGSINGEAFAGNTASDMPLVLGSGSMIKGFEEQLEGLAAGAEKTLAITFPADYPAAALAGKPASFQVRVKSVAEPVLPALDDDLASAYGIASGGIEALRTEVTRNMQRELRGLVGSKLKSQVFEKLLDHNPVDAPRQLVTEEVKALQAQASYRQRPADELAELAAKRVKLGVIVSEIARQQNIQLDAERVRATIETIAGSYEKPEEVVQWYYANQEMLHGVQSSVIEEQVVDWIIEHAGVKVEDKSMSFSELVDEARQTQGK